MSDMNEKELDELEEEEEIENYITLTDDEGNEVSFEIIGTVEYEDHLQLTMMSFLARYSRSSRRTTTANTILNNVGAHSVRPFFI